MKENLKKLSGELDRLKDVKGNLMTALQTAQGIFGYLPFEAQELISQKLNVHLSEVYGVATFYSQFNLEPVGKYKISICMGTACYVRGSGEIMEEFKNRLKIKEGETTPDGLFTLEAARCIGCCGLAPVLTVNDEVFGKATKADVEKIIAKFKQAETEKTV